MYTTSDLVNELNGYFDVRELVCRHAYTKLGDSCWMLFRPELLKTLLVIRRDIIKVPITVNNWNSNGKFTQRGFRCNRCQLVEDKTVQQRTYLSAHCVGADVDFDAKGMTAEKVRETLSANARFLPFPIRLEEAVNWVHLDVYQTGEREKITFFKG